MSEKYEREIEEILRKMSVPPPRRRRSSSGWSVPWHNLTADVSPSRLFLLGLALVLLGWFAGASFPILAAPLTLLAAATLVVGYIVAITNRSARSPRSWRGRVVEPSGNELWSGLWKRWERWWQDRGGNNRR